MEDREKVCRWWQWWWYLYKQRASSSEQVMMLVENSERSGGVRLDLMAVEAGSLECPVTSRCEILVDRQVGELVPE